MTPHKSQRDIDLEALDLLDAIIKSDQPEPQTLSQLSGRFRALGGDDEMVFASLAEQYQARAWLRSAAFSIPEGSTVLSKVTRRRNLRTFRSVAGIAMAVAASLAIVFFLVVPGSTADEMQFLETVHSHHTLPDSAFTPVDRIEIGGHTFVHVGEKRLVGHTRVESRDVFRMHHDDGQAITLVADWKIREFDPKGKGTPRRIGESIPCLCLPVDDGHLIYWNEGNWTMTVLGPRSDGFGELLELANSLHRYDGSNDQATEIVFNYAGGLDFCPAS